MKAQAFRDVETGFTTASSTLQHHAGLPADGLPQPYQEGSVLSYRRERHGAEYAFDNSIVAMVTMDKMENPDIREFFKGQVEKQSEHDRDLKSRAQEREEIRADRKLEADIQLRNTSMNRVFFLFLVLAVGFIVCAAIGVDHKCLWAFGVFLAPAGLALFHDFYRWKGSKQQDNS